MKTTIVLVQPVGLMCNRVVAWSHLIAFAEEHDVNVIYPPFYRYAEGYEGTFRNFWQIYPERAFPKLAPTWLWFFCLNILGRVCHKLGTNNNLVKCIYTLGDDPTFNRNLEEPMLKDSILSTRIVFYFGWRFRCDQLLEKHADAVKAFFRIRNTFCEKVDQLIEEERKGFDTVIGVHLRQGDYRTLMPGLCYPSESYREWMDQMAEVLKDSKPKFIVCAPEVIDKSLFDGLNVVFAQGNHFEDLYMLSRCDFLIGPPSTYNRWASFVGQVPLRMVIAKSVIQSIDEFRVAEHFDVFFEYPETDEEFRRLTEEGAIW